MFSITVRVVHVGVVAEILVTALMKECGVVVSKRLVADVSHVDPGICSIKARFGYGVIQVKKVKGRVPYIVEQVASIFVIHCFDISVVCFFEWYVGVCWGVDGGDY